MALIDPQSYTREEYLDRAKLLIEEWLRSAPGTQSPIAPYLGRECPECEQECIQEFDSQDHVMHAGFVLIACEGYYVIDPNLLGFDAPRWSDANGELTRNWVPKGF